MAGIGQPPGGGGFGQPSGFGAPPGSGGFGAPGMAPTGPPPSDTPNFVLWMVLAGISALVCQGWLTGVIGFVFALLGKQEWDQGQYESAQSKLKWSKIVTIAGFALMGIGIAAYVLIFMFIGVAAYNAPGSY